MPRRVSARTVNSPLIHAHTPRNPDDRDERPNERPPRLYRRADVYRLAGIGQSLEEIQQTTRDELTSAGVWSNAVLREAFGDAYADRLEANDRSILGDELRKVHVEVLPERLALPTGPPTATSADPEVLEAEIIEDEPAGMTTTPSTATHGDEEFFSSRDPVKLRAMLRADQERAVAALKRNGRLSLAALGIIPTPTKHR